MSPFFYPWTHESGDSNVHLMSHRLSGFFLYVSIFTQAILHHQIMLENSLWIQPLSKLLCYYNLPQGIVLGHRTLWDELKALLCIFWFLSLLLSYFVALTLQSVDFYTFSLSHSFFFFFWSGFDLDISSIGLYTSL